MDRMTIMIIVAAAMSAVGIVGDYFLKRASGKATPLAPPAFLDGLALYSSAARPRETGQLITSLR